MNRRVSGLVAGLAALATGAGGVAAVSTAGAATTVAGGNGAGGTQADAMTWGRCEDEALRKAGAGCANIRVPLDYAKPGGRTITLAASRIPATAPADRRQGTLLGSGLSFPMTGKDLGKRIRAEYDLVGFDPRGTGESRPLLSCGKPDPFRIPQPSYLPTTGASEAPGANERAWLRLFETFVQGCTTKYGAALEQYTAMASAYDIDAVRGALGLSTISLYAAGFSEQIYASLFPARVRRIVFVATPDPTLAGYDGLFADSPAAEEHVDRFWAWIAAHHRVYRLGSTAKAVERRFLREERRLARDPVRGVGPAEWSDQILFRSTFDESAWPQTASAFAAWVRGDRGPIRAGAADFASSGAAGTTAGLLNCANGTWPSDYARWRSDGFARAQTYPLFTFPYLLNSLGCRTWPVSRPVQVTGSDVPSMLLVAATEDRTFHRGALELRRQFPNSRYLTVPGSITFTAFSGNTCVDKAIRRYLADGTLPARTTGYQADESCAKAKLPKPLKKDVRAAKRSGE